MHSETVRERASARATVGQANGSPAAGDLDHIFDRDAAAPGSMHNNVEAQGRTDATGVPPEVTIPAPAASALDNGGSEEEMGAFDDSHLQVDQPKKRKKKRSKKPKSKRGLVILGFVRRKVR